MTDIARINQRIGDAQSQKADWNRKSHRLYELVMDVDRGKHTRVDVEETSVNYLLLNCELKVGSLLRQYRLAQLVVQPDAGGLSDWLNGEIKPASHRDMALVLKDRFITGLGVLGVGMEPRTGELVWYRVNPIHFYWSCVDGVESSPWYARCFLAESGVYYEYWDAETYAVLDDQRRVVVHRENPLEMAPFAPIVSFSVPNIWFPMGEAELIYPQQTLLREVRRAILDHARRGAGMMLVHEQAVPDEELYKLSEPGEPYIRVRDLNAIQPIPTPPMNAEWITVETLVKNDLDAQVGISHYLRGEQPIAKNVQFATEVMAQISGQSLRQEIDWLPVKDALVRIAEATVRLAVYNKIRDISIDFGQMRFSVMEDELARMVSANLAENASGGGTTNAR